MNALAFSVVIPSSASFPPEYQPPRWSRIPVRFLRAAFSLATRVRQVTVPYVKLGSSPPSKDAGLNRGWAAYRAVPADRAVVPIPRAQDVGSSLSSIPEIDTVLMSVMVVLNASAGGCELGCGPVNPKRVGQFHVSAPVSLRKGFAWGKTGDKTWMRKPGTRWIFGRADRSGCKRLAQSDALLWLAYHLVRGPTSPDSFRRKRTAQAVGRLPTSPK